MKENISNIFSGCFSTSIFSIRHSHMICNLCFATVPGWDTRSTMKTELIIPRAWSHRCSLDKLEPFDITTVERGRTSKLEEKKSSLNSNWSFFKFHSPSNQWSSLALWQIIQFLWFRSGTSANQWRALIRIDIAEIAQSESSETKKRADAQEWTSISDVRWQRIDFFLASMTSDSLDLPRDGN